MDKTFLGLCHRLYYFIMKCLGTHAMKSVALSHGSHQASDCLPSLGASSAISSSVTCLAPYLVAQETSAEDASLQAEVEVQEMGDSGSTFCTLLFQPFVFCFLKKLCTMHTQI
ncbi:hypothetical protein J1N35_044215 [Gossypium stocksii]|uniref:Uncharacterized protein n=1 Tax=Gossypium stocksii TaxID=47602 RepID=A0A9D3U935_9ROSI|nr:hypothetical protein J1N35_044215 [Gossypium stocksii]